jgi:hypothetical protein
MEFKIVELNIDVDKNLDIFEMTTSYSELMKGLVNMELLSFRPHHVDIKKTKCFFPMVGNMSHYFLLLVPWLVVYFGILGSQIKIEHIFSLVGILTNFFLLEMSFTIR